MHIGVKTNLLTFLKIRAMIMEGPPYALQSALQCIRGCAAAVDAGSGCSIRLGPYNAGRRTFQAELAASGDGIDFGGRY